MAYDVSFFTFIRKENNPIYYMRFEVYVGLDMYREWKKIEFPREYCI
jgi:hypothetical protein